MVTNAPTHRVHLSITLPDRNVHKYNPARAPGGGLTPTPAPKKRAASRGVSAGATETDLSDRPYKFLYLDAGVWAGPERWFAVSCKSCVWLCKFLSESVQQPLPGGAWSIAPRLLREMWKSFTESTTVGRDGFQSNQAFEVVKWAEIPSPAPQEDVVYLFLPDMHLPCIRHWDEFHFMHEKDKEQLANELSRRVNEGSVPGSGTPARKYGEYAQACQADIFRNAGESLGKFLSIISSLGIRAWERKLKVIHMGDMYELWQGTDEWTGYLQHKPGGLELKPGAAEALRNRLGEIEKQTSRLLLRNPAPATTIEFLKRKRLWTTMGEFRILDLLNASVYLYGNHDVYLVRQLADKDPSWKAALDGLGIAPRATHFHQDRILAEHGHRFDDYNKDGNWAGNFITELVYGMPILRELDPDRRGLYHKWTAIDYFYRVEFGLPTFSLYVMAHTHKADLAYVEVHQKRNSTADSRCQGCK